MTDSDGLSLDASLLENICVELGGTRLIGKDLLSIDTIVHKCLRIMMDSSINRSNSISHESNAVVDGDDMDEHVVTTCGVSREVLDDDNNDNNNNKTNKSKCNLDEKGNNNNKGDGKHQHSIIHNHNKGKDKGDCRDDDHHRLFSSVQLRAESIEKEVTYNCRHLCVDLTVTTTI